MTTTNPRTLARELALIQLFQLEFASQERDHVTEIYAEDHSVSKEVIDYANSLLEGIGQKLEMIDHKVVASSRNWRIDRMSKVDRNVLRLATYEMLFADSPLKPSIVIDEAVNLAKIYGSTESGAFVNGILDQIRKDNP